MYEVTPLIVIHCKIWYIMEKVIFSQLFLIGLFLNLNSMSFYYFEFKYVYLSKKYVRWYCMCNKYMLPKLRQVVSDLYYLSQHLFLLCRIIQLLIYWLWNNLWFLAKRCINLSLNLIFAILTTLLLMLF